MTIDPSESLTLDDEARTRATVALSRALADDRFRAHRCADHREDALDDPDDGCAVCWEVAAEVIRAAEGLCLCSRCNGGGTVGPEGDCCPECGGSGLEPLDAGEPGSASITEAALLQAARDVVEHAVPGDRSDWPIVRPADLRALESALPTPLPDEHERAASDGR